MSVTGAMLTGARALFEHLFLDHQCTHYAASGSWMTGTAFPCHVEESSASDGVPLDYEGGNGYGYAVHVPADMELEVTDQIEWNDATNDVGRLSVTRVAPVQTLGLVRVVEAVMR